MKLEVHDGLIRGLPLAALLTLLVQGAGAIWWVSAQAQDNDYLKQRVDKLESNASRSGDVEGIVLQRLARIEERIGAQAAVLERIERKMGN